MEDRLQLLGVGGIGSDEGLQGFLCPGDHPLTGVHIIFKHCLQHRGSLSDFLGASGMGSLGSPLSPFKTIILCQDSQNTFQLNLRDIDFVRSQRVDILCLRRSQNEQAAPMTADPGSPSNAVNVLCRCRRSAVLNNPGDLWEIQASRCNIL